MGFKLSKKVNNAIVANPKCVRASIIEARIFQLTGKFDLAIESYRRLEFQDSNYITEVILPLYDCYKEQKIWHFSYCLYLLWPINN